MPYNSSSFERQLAKYKAEQAQKAVADMPRKKYQAYDDPHKVKSRVPSADRGSIKSYALDPVQIMGEGAQTAPLIREHQPYVPPLIVKSKKPFYKRAWFIFFVVTTLPMLGAPVFYKEETKQLMDLVSSIKTTTGVDPLSAKTYVNLIKGTPQAPETAQSPILPSQEAPSMVEQHDLSQPMDMHNAVEKAQERADSITAKGAGYSMQYIEDETKRLDAMAKEFDKQYKH